MWQDKIVERSGMQTRAPTRKIPRARKNKCERPQDLFRALGTKTLSAQKLIIRQENRNGCKGRVRFIQKRRLPYGTPAIRTVFDNQSNLLNYLSNALTQKTVICYYNKPCNPHK